MADNVSFGSYTAATDDIGGVHYQRAKLVWGADGTATDASAASPLPVGQPGDYITLTPTLDTSAYAAGDVLFATTSLASAFRANDTRALLQSLNVIDKDDQKPAFTLYFFQTNVTFGTINTAPSISDADAANFLGYVDVVSADWKDLGGVSVASIKNIGLMLESVTSATNVYVAATTSSTPTHTASGLVLGFGLMWL